MDAETEALEIGKLYQRPGGWWYVHCRVCEKEAWVQARDEDEAYGMLDEWRLSMPRRQSKNRKWSCPSCRTWWDEEPTTTETAETAATDAAGSAGQLADQRMQRASFDALQLEVVALKAEVVELKAEVERLRWEVHGHVAYDARAAARDNDEILARVLEVVQREVRRRAAPAGARDAADIAVPDEQEETSHGTE